MLRRGRWISYGGPTAGRVSYSGNWGVRLFDGSIHAGLSPQIIVSSDGKLTCDNRQVSPLNRGRSELAGLIRRELGGGCHPCLPQGIAGRRNPNCEADGSGLSSAVIRIIARS